MPDFLNVSRVTPIDKGWDAADASNYGPISTLYSFAQIFEKLVFLQVSTYLKRYNILINFSFVSSKEDQQNRTTEQDNLKKFRPLTTIFTLVESF